VNALLRFSMIGAALLLMTPLGVAHLQAWGVQGHRLVGLIAAHQLTPVACANVSWLLDGASLADVAVWADEYVADNRQTAPWHYVNIPSDATSYDRDRDCPRQPGAAVGSRADRWRDCVVDRIGWSRERLANPSLDRADRAVALKFLVHFVGDLHQPFHALSVARGANDVPVVAFGSPTCTSADGASFPCNLHGVWDSGLIAHRGLSDARYLDDLMPQIKRQKLPSLPTQTPAEWAMESHALATAALLAPNGAVDEAYYRAQIAPSDRRLALGGVRLAALVNQSLTTAPPR
jgi:nuclease S1